jgi:protein N-terminal amidase
MRIALIQTSPTLGAVSQNITKATSLINPLPPEKLDLIILPELAFTGYNFTSPTHITPFVETPTSSPSREWARDIARTRECHVLVGLPTQDVGRYNTAVMVDSSGNMVHEYHKHHMFETDYKWGCLAGPGFTVLTLPLCGRLVRATVGICMDLNPWEFTSPFTAYEFANFVLANDVELVLLPTAWLLPDEYDGDGGPSMSTLTYWIRRLGPLMEDGVSRIVVVCNRTGEEEGAKYAGTSCVFRIGGGDITVLGILGREEGVLNVDVAL